MRKSAVEYFRYLAVNPLDQAWGLSVTGAGYQPVEPGGDPIPKRHHPRGHFYTWDAGRVLTEYAVVYVTHGRGEFDSRDTGRVSLTAGDAVVLFPGAWHRYRPAAAHGWGIYWIHFLGEIADRLRADGIFSPSRAVVRVGIDEAILEAFRGTLDALRVDADGRSLIAAAKTLEILARLKTAAAATRPVPRIQAIVREAQLLLEEDPGGLPDVDELVRRFDVSRTHFFRAFKRQTGQSPYKYHLQLTMRRAGEMLRNSPLSVKQIALSLGFGSPYHFSKLFKSKMGMPPTTYRRRWREAAGPGRIAEAPAGPVA
jgi:AraC-like DNA-binding protein